MVFRRRLIFWLVRAYIRRWGKIIVFSFFIGLVCFFTLMYASRSLGQLIPTTERSRIGIVGAYTVDNMPTEIVNKISRGLTAVSDDGRITPAVAKSWNIKDNGKTYEFFLDSSVSFNDGRQVTSDLITYSFADVTVEKPDAQTIVFKLNDAYAPFLVTVSRPIFRNGYVGIGEYKIDDIELNGNFLKYIKIVSKNKKRVIEEYLFYPSEDALKIAFALGEVNVAKGITDDSFKDTAFTKFPNVNARKVTNRSTLVSLFFNTQDPVLSDKRVRSALGYALPDTFADGERAYLPYPSTSLFYNRELERVRVQDVEHAASLLDTVSQDASASAHTLTITTLKKYKTAAQTVAASWKQVGINVTIEEVDRVPTQFQIYLGDFSVPKDPDQYTLWHSEQINNITKYRNLRIDKLLEDGRKTVSTADRKEIYDDFQKYLLDDSPVTFLYHPQEYEITR